MKKMGNIKAISHFKKSNGIRDVGHTGFSFLEQTKEFTFRDFDSEVIVSISK